MEKSKILKQLKDVKKNWEYYKILIYINYIQYIYILKLKKKGDIV